MSPWPSGTASVRPLCASRAENLQLVDQMIGFDRLIGVRMPKACNQYLHRSGERYGRMRLFGMDGNKLVAIGRIFTIVAADPDTMTLHEPWRLI